MLTVWFGQGGGGGVTKEEILWTIGYGISVGVGISIGEVMADIGVSIEESVTRGCLVDCNRSSANMDCLKECVWKQSR